MGSQTVSKVKAFIQLVVHVCLRNVTFVGVSIVCDIVTGGTLQMHNARPDSVGFPNHVLGQNGDGRFVKRREETWNTIRGRSV